MTDAMSSVAYYRERAADMRKAAEKAPTEATRAAYLDLAANWELLAEQIERIRANKAWQKPSAYEPF